MKNFAEKILDRQLMYKTSVSHSEDFKDNLGLSSMINRSSVPASHKRIADSYMFIKKMYGSYMAFSQISLEEKNILAKFDFAPLEYSTENQIKDELEFLKKWSLSQDINASRCADDILKIRVKELRNILSNRYVFVSNEIYKGFRVLENYLEQISNY